VLEAKQACASFAQMPFERSSAHGVRAEGTLFHGAPPQIRKICEESIQWFQIDPSPRRSPEAPLARLHLTVKTSG